MPTDRAIRKNGRIARTGPPKTSVFVLLLLTFLGGVSTSYAQSSELDALASEAAVNIVSSNTKHWKGKVTVLVVDFRDVIGASPELGSKLADQFRAALKAHAQSFTVLDRDATSFKKADAPDNGGRCGARTFGADVVIQGYFLNLKANKVNLSIQIVRDQKMILSKSATLNLPPEMTLFLHDPESLPDGVRGTLAWARAEHGQNEHERPIRIPTGEEKGYKEPKCLRCPYAPFSKEAKVANAQGTVVLEVEIDTDGLPAAIGVMKPLPCELTRQAVEAVKQWKFVAATGPDGKPVRVLSLVEVTFRLY